MARQDDPQGGLPASPAMVDRLRALAMTAARTGQADDVAVHPDAELLGVCADVLDRHAGIEAVWREWRAVVAERRSAHGEVARALVARVRELTNANRTPMSRLGKLPATTTAGVHAKALVLRRSKGNAPKLAASLADDVLALRGLRAGDMHAGTGVEGQPAPARGDRGDAATSQPC